MSRKKLKHTLLFIGLLTLLLPIRALADAAPPGVPDGENLDPGEETTMVQMVAEEVIIEVGASKEVIHYFDETNYLEGYTVSYNCNFWFENKGTETEKLAVRFPLNGGNWVYGKIAIHSIRVNGIPVPWTEDELDKKNLSTEYSWAHFDVVFPPGEVVEVNVTYTTVSYGWPYSAQHQISYILETGAGWYGPIGKGKIILKLPYQATDENIIVANSNTSEGTFTESEVYWEFIDLEPTAEDNWEVEIVVPEMWLEILAMRKNIEKSPNDSLALSKFANLIFDATVYKGVQIYSMSLYNEGLESIRQAINLDPDNAENHIIYAHYLAAYDDMENSLEILEEVEKILTLDPGNNTRYLKEGAMYNLDRYQTATAYANATATFTATPTPTATSTPEPTFTLTLTQMPTPTVTPTPPPVPDDSSGSTAIIAVVVILVLVGAGTVWAFRRE